MYKNVHCSCSKTMKLNTFSGGMYRYNVNSENGMKQGFYALRWADLQFLEQNSVDKFLLDQSHFMVKFFSE